MPNDNIITMQGIPQLDLDRENGSGRYYIYWTEGRRNKRVSTRQTDLAAAKAFYAEWLKMDRTAATPADASSALTVSDLWDVYMDKKISQGFSEKGAGYCWVFLAPYFGPMAPADITQDVVDDYIARRKAGKIGPRKVKGQTVRRELSYIVSCLNFCSGRGKKALKNPLFDPKVLIKFDLPEEGEPRDRWLTEEECERLIAAARAMNAGSNKMSKLELFLWLALYTGGRVAALLELTWDRVDFDSATPVLHLAVPGRKKSKKGRPSVPIAKVLLPVLRLAHEQRENDFVLGNQGKMWASLQLCAIKAGLAPAGYVARDDQRQKPKSTGITPHVLRHTAATHMARRGVPLWKIAKILGNTLEMVEKVYAKHCPDDLAEAVDLIGPRQALLKEVKSA